MTTPQPESSGAEQRYIERLAQFQSGFRLPVSDSQTESPDAALRSLENAAESAPASYRPYLHEAIRCYQGGMYRATVLMIWAATIQVLYERASADSAKVRAIEAANAARNRTSKNYRAIKKRDDFLYIQESSFLLLCEDVGLFNRNARQLLAERLTLRNRCGHPTGYAPGREETVVFVESLLLNVVSGGMLNW